MTPEGRGGRPRRGVPWSPIPAWGSHTLTPKGQIIHTKQANICRIIYWYNRSSIPVLSSIIYWDRFNKNLFSNLVILRRIDGFVGDLSPFFYIYVYIYIYIFIYIYIYIIKYILQYCRRHSYGFPNLMSSQRWGNTIFDILLYI